MANFLSGNDTSVTASGRGTERAQLRAKLQATDDPFNGLEAARIYPVSRVSEWVAQIYRRWITDDSNAGRIGETGLYSLQNGLLLTANMHPI